jgi:hypothetical protein
MDNEHFPHYGLGGTVPELYLMDLYPLNTHINHDKWDVIRQYVDLRTAVRLEDDFLKDLGAVDWTVTKTGAGTNVITDAANGVLLITNAAADNDKTQYLSKGQSFILKPGFPLYVEGRFKINEVVQSDFFFGLVDAEYLGASTAHGVYFHKDDGSASLLIAVEDSTVVVDLDTGIDAVAATYVVLAFHYDGAGTVRWFVFTDAGIVLAQGEITAGFPLNEELFLGFGAMNGEAVAKNLSVDYVKAVMARIV